MGRKTALLTALTVLIAFAAPIAAQADELVDSEGALEVEAEITATSENFVMTTALGTVTCELVTFHGHLESNGPAVDIKETATTTENCNTPVSSPMLGDIHIAAGGGKTSFTGLTVGGGACWFTGILTFLATPFGDTLTVTGKEQLGDPFCGRATVEGSFTLETENGDPVFIE